MVLPRRSVATPNSSWVPAPVHERLRSALEVQFAPALMSADSGVAASAGDAATASPSRPAKRHIHPLKTTDLCMEDSTTGRTFMEGPWLTFYEGASRRRP